MKLTYVIKKNGERQVFEPEKINQWVSWACEDTSADWSSIVVSAVNKMYDGATTTELQLALISSCVDLIAQDVAYDKVAARLYLANLRKEVYGQYQPPDLIDFYDQMVASGSWEKMEYSRDDILFFQAQIDHSRDSKFSYAGLKQIQDRYLLTDKRGLLESPQFVYMGMAMHAFQGEPLSEVVELYDILSNHQVNVPTPVLVGLRTSDKGFPSCCIIKAYDELESIHAAMSVAYTMTANRAGIGMELGVRSVRDDVRNGAFEHLGKLPYYNLIDRTVKANSQQCYSADTEILTSVGWKLFSDLDQFDQVAQIADGRDMLFVTPTELMVYDYEGPMQRFHGGQVDLLVTPSHTMLYREADLSDGPLLGADPYVQVLASDWTPDSEHLLDCGGPRFGDLESLTPKQRLEIAFSVFGTEIENPPFASYSFCVKSIKHLSELTDILDAVGIKEIDFDVSGPGYTIDSLSDHTIVMVTPCEFSLLRKLDWVYDLDFSSRFAAEFLKDLSFWTGEWKTPSLWSFCSYSGASNIVQFLAVCADLASSTVDRNHCEVDFSRSVVRGSNISVSSCHYRDKVYCVEVPSHKLVVRRNGLTAVCGNSRGGSATVQFNIFDPEIESLIRLKSQRVSDERRIDKIDYSLGINDFFIRRIIKDEPLTLFSIKDAPQVYELFFSKDIQGFADAYEAAEADMNIPRTVISTASLFSACMRERVDTGRMYVHRVDISNARSTFLDAITSSNLCVAPDTRVLTDRGQELISDLVDRDVMVWNGHEYSEVTVSKTGDRVPLLRVTMSHGQTLDCTPYHKWHVMRDHEIVEVTTDDLRVGDPAEMFLMPALTDGADSPEAYALGHYAAKGILIDTKDPQCSPGDHSRFFSGLCPRLLRDATGRKVLVPISGFSQSARVAWLSGFMNESGSTDDRDTLFKSLFISHSDMDLLREVRLMLDTLGCVTMVDAEKGRLVIPAAAASKLFSLGLDFQDPGMPDPESEEFPRRLLFVASIEDLGRVDDTYCFNEPLRHRGVFNGILTGQCLEILEPTKGFSSPEELYKTDGDGEVALCNIGGIACGRVSDEEYPRVAYILLKMVDSVLELQAYPYPAIETTAKKRRSVGIGMINVAHALASNGYKYSTLEGRNFIHRETEKFSYWLHKASVQLAIERGPCEWFHKTTYSQGALPMDSATPNIDEVHTQPLLMDWEGLRKEIATHGMRNSVLEAQMPSETSSVTISATNGCEPVRELITFKSSVNTLPFIAPDYENLKDKYELAFDIDNQRYAEFIGIMQKFFGQSISYNEYYDYKKYPKGRIPVSTVVRNWIYGAKMGIKTWYYLNSEVSTGGAAHQGCDSGACEL